MPLTTNQRELIKKYNTQGITNRQIAKKLNCHWNTITYWNRKFGLTSNGKYRQHLNMVSKNLAKCSKCNKIKKLNNFSWGRRAKYPYQLSYCNSCKQQQQINNLNKNIENFLIEKHRRLKQRALKMKINFNISRKYLLNLYNNQNGKCFYTGVKMKVEYGTGRSKNSLSVDKIIPENGYIKNNVVLCCSRINTIKSDVSLDEMEVWMPIWFYKIKKFKDTIK